MLINQHETQFPILFWLIDQAVFERLVDIICDKMSESLDSDPNMVNSSKGTRLTDQTPAPNAGACQCWTPTNTHFPDPARQPKKIPQKIIRRHQQKKSVYKCGTSAIFQNDKKRNNFTIFFSPPNIPFVFQCWIISIITVSIQKKKKSSLAELIPSPTRCFYSSAFTPDSWRACTADGFDLFWFGVTDTQVRLVQFLKGR
jgi:hypothetical protein